MNKGYLVTHVSPDMDAIGSCWLLQLYDDECATADVEFVNTGNPDPYLLECALAVVDTGGMLDPEHRRFDHHQLTGRAARTSATMQVFEWLLAGGRQLDYLRPLIELINAGDLGLDAHGAKESREFGIHALLSEMKHDKASDQEMLSYGCWLLDQLARRLERKQHAALAVRSSTVYISADKRLIALKDAAPGATFAAYDLGYDVVLFQSEIETPDGTSHSIGAMRKSGVSDVHVGGLVERILSKPIPDLTYNTRDELSRWYRHEAGFFAGRGSSKAPVYDLITVDLARIAQLLDIAWER